MMTFGGANPEMVKELGENIVTFFNQAKERRIEVFPQLLAGPGVCRNTPDYLTKAIEIGHWVAL